MTDATYLNHLASNLTTEEGPTSEYGKAGEENYTTTTEEADEIYIGYAGKKENGDLITSVWDGDFERDSDDGEGVWTLDTAEGDDFVRIRDDQNGGTVARLGSGNDMYLIGNALDSDLSEIRAGNESARAYVYAEEGDDTVSVGHIDGGRIFAGAGSDDITINGEVDDGGVIDLGSGRGEYSDDAAALSADDETAVNNLHIKGSLGESADYDFGAVLGGAGQDNVTIDREMEGISVVDLGDNDDSVSVAYMQHDSKILTGNDDDTVIVDSVIRDNTLIDTSGIVTDYVPAVPGTPFIPGTPDIPATPDKWIQLPDGSKIFVKGTPFIPGRPDIPATPGTPAIEARTDDDYVEIGYDTQGNSKIITGAGEDTIKIGNDVDDNSSISAGEGDDTVIIGDDIENTASVDLGNGDNVMEVASQIGGLSKVTAGEGDDTLNVGYAIATQSVVNLGEGDNRISTGDDIDDSAQVITGAGDDTLVVGDDVENNAVINLGEGNNDITIADQFGGNARLTTGAGDDSLNIGYALATNAVVDLGEGNNDITIGDDVDGYTTLTTGAGNDTLVVGDDFEDGSNVNLGDGNNLVTVADDLEDSSVITLGAGDDKLEVGDSAFNSASADLGAGNDSVTVGGGIFHNAQISGGEGQDTLTFTYAESDKQVTGRSHFTGMSTDNFDGFEVVELNGKNALDVRFEDLVNDESRDGALFIRGTSESKVDLGDTNWNSDNADRAKFDDRTGGEWSNVGQETVDGVVYDIYQNSLATDVSNNVYIEQGIVVI